jgi:hypothetical protein
MSDQAGSDILSAWRCLPGFDAFKSKIWVRRKQAFGIIAVIGSFLSQSPLNDGADRCIELRTSYHVRQPQARVERKQRSNCHNESI